MSLAVTIARHWPFANGSGRIIDRFAAKVDAGSGEQVVWANDGFQINVLADDLIGRHIKLTGQFDRSIVQVLLDQALPGDVLLDIGANIGYVSCVFLKRVKDSTAVCVEPQPGIADLLKKNLARFPGRSVHHEVLLSDHDGTGWLQIDRRNRGASRVVHGNDLDAVERPMRDAGKLLVELSKVDLIKIDVEGHEEPILRAIEAELKRLQPRAILFEDQSGEAGPDGAIGSILTRLGYRVFGIEKRLLKTVLIAPHRGCNDFLACK
jgi:FkbM family methyltransferase